MDLELASGPANEEAQRSFAKHKVSWRGEGETMGFSGKTFLRIKDMKFHNRTVGSLSLTDYESKQVLHDFVV
jgi:hypothetical protein